MYRTTPLLLQRYSFMHLLYRISRCTYSSNVVNEPLAFSLSTSSTNDLFHCTMLPLSVPLMVPRQPVVERYLDRALQQAGRTHFTIVTCRSVPLHPPLFEHSNHPFCSFFRVFQNKILANLLHLNTKCQGNELL